MRPTRFREFWEYTVEKVAVNAVMAGARPEYFPVILAMAASGQTARSSSTTSIATISVVNGPIRNEIGMNAGIGVLGPYNHANATIGRAFSLLSQNLQGGSVPGESYMGSLGNLVRLHAPPSPRTKNAARGSRCMCRRASSRPTAPSACSSAAAYTQSGYGPRDTWKERFIRCLAATDHYIPPLLVLDPIAARGFVELGFDTKEKLIDWCAENARLPAREYWDDQWIQTLIRPLAVAGVEPYATRLKAEPDEIIQMFEPQEINIVVAGGETQGAWKMIGGSLRNATISVDAWR